MRLRLDMEDRESLVPHIDSGFVSYHFVNVVSKFISYSSRFSSQILRPFILCNEHWYIIIEECSLSKSVIVCRLVHRLLPQMQT